MGKHSVRKEFIRIKAVAQAKAAAKRVKEKAKKVAARRPKKLWKKTVSVFKQW